MKTLSRRTLLRGAGVALGLPWLERMSPLARSMSAVGDIPKRAVFTFWGLGLNGRDYTPSAPGPDYPVTPILKPLQAHRKDFTVITGLKLANGGGHGGDRSFLTGDVTHKSGSAFHISVDQMLAEHVGNVTRFPSLVLGIERGGIGSAQDNTLSWTRNGTPIPSENRPDVIFDRLFRQETAKELAAREREAALEASVLDAVRDSAKGLEKQVGTADRRKLEEYFASIRDIEKRVQVERAWLHKEKPKVAMSGVPSIEPVNKSAEFDYRGYQRLMYDLLTLALQTDSTRVVSYMARKDLSDGTGTYRHLGNPYGYHTLTHHGEDPEKLKWNTQVDIWHMEDWAYFIGKLKSVKEGEGTLLDHVLLARSSSGGTLNAHNNRMLPTLLAGGGRIGIRHCGHLVVDEKPLGNFWRTMTELMGMPTPSSPDYMGGEHDGIIKEIVNA